MRRTAKGLVILAVAAIGVGYATQAAACILPPLLPGEGIEAYEARRRADEQKILDAAQTVFLAEVTTSQTSIQGRGARARSLRGLRGLPPPAALNLPAAGYCGGTMWKAGQKVVVYATNADGPWYAVDARVPSQVTEPDVLEALHSGRRPD